MGKLLEIQNLSKTFTMHILNDKKIGALEDVTMNLDEGEAIGLTGRSGSGKSTLMKCIYRTYLASSGHVVYHSQEWGPVDLVKGSDAMILALRKKEIRYCSQFLEVIPRVPAVDVVASRLVEQGVERDVALDQTREMLARLNLPEELWDAYPSTFSGGEQQRINIAQAMISKPRFLLVDEPTASLDPRTKDVVIEMLLDLKSEGTSIVCITHDAYTLERVADKVFRMEVGSFVPVSAAMQAMQN